MRGYDNQGKDELQKQMQMNTTIPAFWGQFAKGMYVDEMPSANLVVSQFAPFSFGRIWSEEGLPTVTRGEGAARDHMVALQLADIPSIEQFLGNRKVSHGSYPVGGVSVLSFEERPRLFLPNPFDTLVLHVTQASLDEVAASHRVPRVDRLSWPFGLPDPVVHHLGHVLLATLDQPNHASRFFVDHVLHALHCHFVCTYGGIALVARPRRGGLTALQMRKATEFLDTHLDGNVDLQQVAAVCDLSLSHFARAFRQTYGKPPYRWLIERRIDKARELLMNTRLPLSDIAVRCGFTDQSGFNRSFKRMYGITPGIWRRSNG
jgi:AraC-like DNA-binding protein